jgi:hypothetical protein
MASGITNKGKYKILGWSFRAATIPTNFYLALATSATTPDADTNTLGQLTEIAATNGYTTGGYSLTPGATDFPDWTEVDASDWATLLLKDIVWTADSGNIPASGNGARWAVLTDDNVTVGSREIYAWYDLVSDRTVSNGQTLTLADVAFKLTAPA